jgi:hypothetical protein
MTPKEKAFELIDKFKLKHKFFTNSFIKTTAKECALIAVDEILKAVDNPDETYLMKHSVQYWSQVKQEIENL